MLRRFLSTTVVRKILLVDGDQVSISNASALKSRFQEIHVFKNFYSGVQRPYSPNCQEHILTKEQSIKEAVDHAITFYCGENSKTWMDKHITITIISKDKSFRNVQNFLRNKNIACDILADKRHL